MRLIDYVVKTSGFWRSGLFFMIVGGFLLYAAYETVGATHAGLTFVFVVVGVAILLYGTGTQSFGDFSANATSEASARVILAGGAGALAILIGAAIVFGHKEMTKAFSNREKFVKVKFAASNTGQHRLTDCVLEVSVNGEPVPVEHRSRKYIVAYVKWDPTDVNVSDRYGKVQLDYQTFAKYSYASCETEQSTTDKLDFVEKVDDTSGGLGLAEYRDDVYINFVQRSLVNVTDEYNRPEEPIGRIDPD